MKLWTRAARCPAQGHSVRPVAELMAALICLPDSFHIREKPGPPRWDSHHSCFKDYCGFPSGSRSPLPPPPPPPAILSATRHHLPKASLPSDRSYIQKSSVVLIAVGSRPPSSRWHLRAPWHQACFSSHTTGAARLSAVSPAHAQHWDCSPSSVSASLLSPGSLHLTS